MSKIQTTRIFSIVDAAVKGGYTTVSAQGSSRSSKTYNILIWLVNYCLQHPKIRLSIIRETLPAIKGSVLIDFKEILDTLDLTQSTKENKTEHTYRFPNGSWVEFFSADDEQKLRGRKRHILYVNEANEITEIKWRQLKMRTTLFSVVDYNPSFSDDHWLCGLNKDQRTYHFISTYKDNPFLEQTIIDEIESLKDKNPSLWRIYGLGLQSMVEGLVFKDVEVIDKIPLNIRKRWIGMDFGYTNDPTAICEVAIQGNNLYIDEICYKTHMLTSDIIDILKSDCIGRKIISECADPRLIEEIYRAGINIHPVKKYAGSIDAGINKMLEYKIHITKRSTSARKEFKNYTYKQDKEGKWLNTPIDSFNHSIDGIRYVIMNEVMGGIRKPINKKRIAAKAY